MVDAAVAVRQADAITAWCRPQQAWAPHQRTPELLFQATILRWTIVAPPSLPLRDIWIIPRSKGQLLVLLTVTVIMENPEPNVASRGCLRHGTWQRTDAARAYTLLEADALTTPQPRRVSGTGRMLSTHTRIATNVDPSRRRGYRGYCVGFGTCLFSSGLFID